MITISNDSIIMIKNNIVSCDLDGEAAILNMNDGIYYGLDPIGAKIWNLIQKPVSINSIVDEILVEFDIDLNNCLSDTIELIEELYNNGLVEIK